MNTAAQVAARSFAEGFKKFLHRLLLFGLELGFFAAFFWLYFLGRGFREDTPGPATANAERLISLERKLGIFWEQDWHQWAAGHNVVIEAANVTYSMLHLPLIFWMGAVFFMLHMGKYRVLRNALLLSGLIAMPFYHLFPLTPPRLLDLNGIDLGFVDTVGALRGSKSPELTNNYAAMPSYHFGWILLVVYGSWWYFRSWWIRGLAAAFAAWMWCCTVFTANHYFLDMVAGAALVTAAFVVCLWWERFLDCRPDAERRWCFARTFWGERFRVPF